MPFAMLDPLESRRIRLILHVLIFPVENTVRMILFVSVRFESSPVKVDSVDWLKEG
jgi:hypothetical protein